MRSEERDLLKENPKNYISLYDWTDSLSGAHTIIYSMLKGIQSKDVLTNMEAIKQALDDYSKYDEKRLKLIKVYLKTYLDRQAKRLYYSSISALLLGTITFILTKMFEGQTPEYLDIFFSNFEPLFLIPTFVVLAIILGLFGLKGDTRIKLILNLIEEYEGEHEKSDRN